MRIRGTGGRMACDSPRAPVPRGRLPRGWECVTSVVRVKSRSWPGVRLPSLLCSLRLVTDPDGFTETVQVDQSRVRAQSRVSLSGGRVTAHLLDTGLRQLL